MVICDLDPQTVGFKNQDEQKQKYTNYKKKGYRYMAHIVRANVVMVIKVRYT